MPVDAIVVKEQRSAIKEIGMSFCIRAVVSLIGVYIRKKVGISSKY